MSKWTLSTYQFGQNLQFSWMARDLTPIVNKKVRTPALRKWSESSAELGRAGPLRAGHGSARARCCAGVARRGHGSGVSWC